MITKVCSMNLLQVPATWVGPAEDKVQNYRKFSAPLKCAISIPRFLCWILGREQGYIVDRHFRTLKFSLLEIHFNLLIVKMRKKGIM